MSATAEIERLPRAEALDLASQAMRALSRYCERLELAGSLRRRTQTVGDIELVAVPKKERVQVGLFEDDVQEISRLDEVIRAYLGTPRTRWALRLDRAGRGANGPKYKRLTFDGFGLDLFVCTPPAQWGVIFAIRTGPWLFSKQLVSHRNVRIDDPRGIQRPRWGILPDDMKVEHGALWRGGQSTPIPTPEEVHFFEAIGATYREPWERK